MLLLAMAANNRTLQDAIDLGQTITAWCHNPKCAHHAELDLRELRDRFGPDHGAMHDDLVPKLRCMKCGGKLTRLTITSGAGEQSGNAYPKAKAGR